MRKLLISLLLLAVCISGKAQEASSYNNFVQIIKSNNPALKALSLELEAKKQSNKIGNTPSDPELSAAPVFNGDTEVVASVGFAFPTLYHQTKRLAKFSSQKNEIEYYIALFNELRNIDNAYITAIYMNKKNEIADKILDKSEKATKYIEESFKKGNSNIIEYNTAKAKNLTTNANYSTIKAELKQSNNNLVALNGGNNIEIKTTEYPLYNLGDIESYVSRAKANSYDLKLSRQDSLIAMQNIRVNKHSWTPNMTIGYKGIITSSNDLMNGMVAGISLPLWQNLHKVRAAKLSYAAAIEQNRVQQLKITAELQTLKDRFVISNEVVNEFAKCTETFSNIDLLDKALEAGQISIVDYYSELEWVFELEIKKLDAEYQHYLLLAQMQSLLY